MAEPRGGREQWASRRGFVLAAVGCAVGLGNVWRFPYTVAEHGGAAFVLVYLVLTAAVGVPLLLAELALGRRGAAGPVVALGRLGGPRWQWLGWAFVAGVAAMLAYYGVIGGWTLRYVAAYFAGHAPTDPATFFSEAATGPGAAAALLAFLAMSAAIVARGVRGGIERLATCLLPLLAATIGGLACYAATLDGAAQAYTYLLRPDFDALRSLDTWSHAAGQTFFSLSLGMGAMLTFGSYLARSDGLARSSIGIAAADLMVALIAGLAVFPLLFALGGAGDVAENAIGALFIAIPSAFAGLGTAGEVLGLLFFAALAVGAWTSAVAMLEVVVAAVVEATGARRAPVTWALAAGIAVVGLAPALDRSVLAWMDRLAGELFAVAGGLVLALFVGWFMQDPAREIGGPGSVLPRVWVGAIRVVVPAVLAVLLWSALGSTWAAATAGLPG